MTREEKKVFDQVVTALYEARAHLNWCGYGDSWERKCADKLPELISDALIAADTLSSGLIT